jgi:hypothetical protein
MMPESPRQLIIRLAKSQFRLRTVRPTMNNTNAVLISRAVSALQNDTFQETRIMNTWTF